MRSHVNAIAKVALWTALGSLAVTGCEFRGLHDVQLPGGAATGGDSYRVTVEFRDVLDLVPQSTVKVNNVTVGAVEDITLRGWRAQVELRISDKVKLPANAIAELHQTSILGEKYVSLAAPKDVRPVGRLKDGTKIPLSRSGRNPEIEEVLSALSALLNGGGVAHLKTISQELNNALEGREDRVKSLLTELDTFLGGLDTQRTEIVRALENLDKLAKRLRAEKQTISQALDTVPGGLRVLADQRRNLTRMLTALSKVGSAGTRVIRSSQADLVANLRHLQPILTQLNEAGNDLPNALEILTSYPFPRNTTKAIQGDFVNMRITADLDLKNIYGNLTKTPERRRPDGSKEPPSDEPKAPELPELPGDGGDGGLPGISESEEEGKDGLLCPPVCTSSSYASYQSQKERGFGADVNMALVELLTRGLYG